MSVSADAAYILDRMHVQNFPRMYVLGCRAPRLTVLSQQYRAFNLIWALFSEGRLKSGDRVGIVGGGIGGLTAAAAAMLKGCSVVVTEQHQQLMHIQRRCTTRLLHPNIYDWPRQGAEDTSTRFPSMNWQADEAAQVVERLDNEWETLKSQFHPQVHINRRVTEVKKAGTDGQLVLHQENTWRSNPCDAVIIAVGFGIEPPIPGMEHFTYWENENFEQSPRSGSPTKLVLVSGLGDGGYIDVLRLKYSNFKHTKFADTVARHVVLEKYKKRLLEIEDDLPHFDQEKYLYEEYKKLHFPADLADSLGTIRNDTDVVLNGRNPDRPLSPNACILHRVAIWALLIAKKINYKAGEIKRDAIVSEPAQSGLKYFIGFSDSGFYGFDRVVLRHGPAPCLGVLPGIETGYTGITEPASKDKTRVQMYPDDFYPVNHGTEQVNMSGVITSSMSSPIPSPSIQPGGVALPVSANPVSNSDLVVRLQSSEPVSKNLTHVVEIELLALKLVNETRAENYIPAVEAANALEAYLVGTDFVIPPKLWMRSNKALFDFEEFLRKRMAAGGGQYDLGRMQVLVRRMRRGTK